MRLYEHEELIEGPTDEELADAVRRVGVPTPCDFRIGLIDVAKIAELIERERMGPAWEMGFGHMWWVGQTRGMRPRIGQPASVLGIAWFTLVAHCKIYRVVGERFGRSGRIKRNRDCRAFGVDVEQKLHVNPVLYVLPALAVGVLHGAPDARLRGVYRVLAENPLDVASWAALADLLDDLDCPTRADEARGRMALAQTWEKRRREVEAMSRPALNPTVGGGAAW